MNKMTNAARSVLAAVKAGQDVVVDHLSAEERIQVCKALGITAPTHWLYSMPYAAPKQDVKPVRYADVEARILERQDAFYEGE